MKWLLDTNVVSEPVRQRPDARIVAWITREPASKTAISVVCLAELRDGASTAREGSKRRQLTEWIDTTVVPGFRDRILPLTSEILTDWIGLSRGLKKQGKTKEASGLLIAATARVHGLIVVSRNVRDFAGTGVALYDPWTDEMHRLELA